MTRLSARHRAVAPVWLVAGIALVVVSACSGLRNRRSDLKDAVHTYVDAIRWGHVERAAAYIPADKRGDFVERKRVALARMRVHEVELRSVDLTDEDSRARVIVTLVWSNRDAPVTHQEAVEQRWQFRGSEWLLIEQRPIEAKEAPPADPKDLF